jgi:hypothetical protein
VVEVVARGPDEEERLARRLELLALRPHHVSNVRLAARACKVVPREGQPECVIEERAASGSRRRESKVGDEEGERCVPHIHRGKPDSECVVDLGEVVRVALQEVRMQEEGQEQAQDGEHRTRTGQA